MASKFDLFLKKLFPKQSEFVRLIFRECFRSDDGRPLQPTLLEIMAFVRKNNFKGKNLLVVEKKTRRLLNGLEAWGVVYKPRGGKHYSLSKPAFATVLRYIEEGYPENGV